MYNGDITKPTPDMMVRLNKYYVRSTLTGGMHIIVKEYPERGTVKLRCLTTNIGIFSLYDISIKNLNNWKAKN